MEHTIESSFVIIWIINTSFFFFLVSIVLWQVQSLKKRSGIFFVIAYMDANSMGFMTGIFGLRLMGTRSIGFIVRWSDRWNLSVRSIIMPREIFRLLPFDKIGFMEIARFYEERFRYEHNI